MTAFDCDVPAVALARVLIGARLVSRIGGVEAAGVIIETEAYLRTGDPAAHAFRGVTQANASAFGPPGTLYIHPMRALCGLDIVARDGSVLIRALEPVAGLETMTGRRGGAPLRLVAAGPGRLTQALGITRVLDGRRLGTADCPLSIVQDCCATYKIISTPRIGVRKAVEWPLRFCAGGHPLLSTRRWCVRN